MSNTKPFWLIFLQDMGNPIVHGKICGHNCKGDYIHHPSFKGSIRIEVDLEKMEIVHDNK